MRFSLSLVDMFIRRTFFTIISAASLALASQARADTVVVTTPERHSYEDRDVGVGAILGDPTAVGVKFRFDDNNALQLGLGWGFVDPFGDRFTMMLDYLVHFTVLSRDTWKTGLLQPYVGIGAKLGFREEPYTTAFGGRVPLGLAFMVREVPLEVFFEVAPGVVLFPGVRPSVDGGLGARFYF